MYPNRSLIFFFLFFALCLSCTRHTENDGPGMPYLDSLITTWYEEAFTNPDGVKVKIVNQLKTIDDSIEYYKMYTLYANCMTLSNKNDSFNLINNQIISFCERNSNHKEKDQIYQIKGNAWNNKGTTFQLVTKLDSAIECYKKSAEAFDIAGVKRNVPELYINMADCYNQIGGLPYTADYYTKAMMLADSIGRGDELRFSIYSGLGKVYCDLMNFDKAEYYFGLIENEFDERPIHEKYYYATSVANHYYTKKEYKKAFPWFLKAEDITKNVENEITRIITNVNLGEIYLFLNKTDSAEYYLNRARKIGASQTIPDIRYYMNGLYASLNLLNGNLDEAEKILKNDTYSPDIRPNNIYLNNKRLEELYVRRGDYRLAYNHRILADEYNDSLRNVTLQNNMAEMSLRHERDTMLLNRDKEILARERRVLNLRSQNTMIISFTVILIILVLLGLFYWRRVQKQKVDKQLNKLAELRAKNIKNRMTPHYIKNVITAAMPSLRDNVETTTMDLLVKSLRNELLQSDKIYVELREELEIVKNYVDLYRSTSQNFPAVVWKIDPDIDQKINVPSMIMQIPVENALKSAFPDFAKDNKLDISLVQADNRISIVIADNGVGFKSGESESNENGTKKGLQILKQTIELLNSKNIEKIEFDIRSSNPNDSARPGTTINISIPTTYKYEL